MSQEGEVLPFPREGPGEDDLGRRIRFGVFELALASGELRKSGALVKLRHQPAKVLAHLASRPGRVVTRDELQAAVWGGDTFVDFDQGLNYCIKEIRAALSDSADTPLYVETLPRRGYRFIAPVEVRGGPAAEVEPETPLPTLVPARSLWPLRALAAVSVTATLAALFFAMRSEAPPPDWQRVTFRRGALSAARFGPGAEIVFSAAWDGGPSALYVATPGSPDARALDGAGARLASVTAGGDAVFLLKQAGAPPLLARLPLAGGPVKPILESVLAADATGDGAELAVAHRVMGKGVLVEFPIGRVLAPVNAPSHLRISPDGQRVAFLEHPRTGDDRGFVVVLHRGGRPPIYSSSFASVEGLAWSATGDEVWFTAARVGSSTSLLALDAARGRERVLLPASGRLVLHDVARDGRVLLERAAERASVRFWPADGGERDLTWFDATRLISLSADGALALLNETGEAGGAAYATYMRRTDASPAVRLGSGVGTALSPDGRFALAVPVKVPDHIDVLPTGPGEARELRFDGIVQYEWAGYTPDGARIVFVGGEPDRNLRVFVGGPSGGRPLAITPEGFVIARDLVSPDSRTVIGPCRPASFCLYPLDAGEPRRIAGLGSFVPVGFTADGGALLVRTREATIPLELFRLDLATGRRESWKTLRPPDLAGLTGLGSVVLSRDGRSLAYNFSTRLSELYLAPRLPNR